MLCTKKLATQVAAEDMHAHTDLAHKKAQGFVANHNEVSTSQVMGCKVLGHEKPAPRANDGPRSPTNAANLVCRAVGVESFTALAVHHVVEHLAVDPKQLDSPCEAKAWAREKQNAAKHAQRGI